MKKAIAFIISLLFCLGLIMFSSGHAFCQQTIITFQDNFLTQCRHTGGACTTDDDALPNPDYTGVFSAANPQWTRWIQVNSKRTIVFDITFTDANTSINSIDMACYTSQLTTGGVGTGYRLPVYVATAASGITTSTILTIRQVATGGGGPGSSNWPWAVTNITGAWIMCSFNATGGAIDANIDTIVIKTRGITP